VVEALRSSPSLLEVSEDGTKVRRKTPLPTDTDATPRIVYAVRLASHSFILSHSRFSSISPARWSAYGSLVTD
jgi:hypothetical protein